MELLARLRIFGLENERLDTAVARATGVPVSDLHALDHLHAAGRLTPGELASRLSLTTGAVTALIDRLEVAGWVQRSPHPTDRRSTLLELTDAVEEIVEDEYGDYRCELERVAKGLSGGERATVARFLDAAAEVAARQAAARLAAMRP